MLLTTCGREDVEPVQINYCGDWQRMAEAMTPEEQKHYAKSWGVMVESRGSAGSDTSYGW